MVEAETASADAAKSDYRTRRKILVDSRFQMKFFWLWLSVGCGVLVLGCIAYIVIRQYLGAGHLDPLIVRVIVWMVGFVVLLCGLMGTLTVVVTHRVSGAAFNLQRCMRRIGRNDLEAPVRLRTGDYLQDLASDLEDLRDKLRARQDELRTTIESLERIKPTLPADQSPALDTVLAKLRAMTQAELGDSTSPQGPAARA